MSAEATKRAAQRPDRVSRSITVNLDPDAFEYVKEMCPGERGHGRFVSIVILEHKLRREYEAKRRQGKV